MTEPVVTEEMIEAGARAIARLKHGHGDAKGVITQMVDLRWSEYIVEATAAIIAALKAAPSPWRPIAEALRVGHKYGGPAILGWDGAEMAVVQWSRLDEAWVGDINPTHFHPLPLPPGDE